MDKNWIVKIWGLASKSEIIHINIQINGQKLVWP